METCVKDANPLYTYMVTATADFKDGSYTRIANGINQFGQFITQVGTALEGCPQVGTERVAKLKKMGDAFLHPKQIILDDAQTVLVNGIEIYRDINLAGDDMNNEHWEAAGKLYGTIAAEVLYGKEIMDRYAASEL